MWGTNFGLRLAKEFTNLLGGNIKIKPALGKGTKVTLWIKNPNQEKSDELEGAKPTNQVLKLSQ